MKSKFTTVDIIAMVAELNDRLAGMRVAQVYDADHKTYLLKLQRPEQKAVLLLESGARIHATEYEWPKNPAPSGFSMKLRKHIRNKRLESIRQLGVDRVVDLQFGSGEVAHHVILELYDRGNLVLTDHQYTILNILRPRTDAESVRFASKENYPLDKARLYETRSEQQLREVVTAAKEGDVLKKVINPHLDFGAALIEHLLLEAGFPAQARVGHEFSVEDDMHRLVGAVRAGEAILKNEQQDFKGIVTYRVERRAAGGQKAGSGSGSGGDAEVLAYQEFHPLLYVQHADQPHHTFLSFTSAVDEYFSKLESQKLDMKAVQQERDALKKLDNVRRDHQRRLEALELAQRDDRWRAELITSNAPLVDGAALVVRSALANQIDWREIGRIVQEAQKRGDPVARSIKALKLEANHITMLLHDPYQEESEEEEEEEEDQEGGEDGAPPAEKSAPSSSHIRPMLVDIDLDLSALANATRYFGQKRTAAKKQQKTVESSFKAMKSAEQKTKQTLKEAATIASINKARRVHWFEKFIWFISSENYLVIGGRDQQQNEILVRRYLKPGDVYVHGDLHGAASLVVKNPAGGEVPPKTLNEAGSFAVCNSSAWDAKIVTSAWWVYAHQVSKTAPTGEYLTTGSFMVRGKKNPLPPCHLVLGFGVLFKLEESSLERHRGERRVRTLESEDAPRPAPVEGDGPRSPPTGEAEGAASSPAGAAKSREDGDGAAAQEDGSSQEEDGEKEEEEKGDSEDAEAEEKEEAEAESEEENAFPDTNVEVKHLKGSKFTVEVTSPTDTRRPDNPFPALPGSKPPAAAAARRGGKKPPSAGKEKKQNCAPPPQPRGKRSKMKRAMEKYKDQDDEEREARMAILQSAGRSHAAVAEEKRVAEVQEKEERVQQQQQRRREQQQKREQAAEDDVDEEETVVPQDCQILDEFTGMPVDEDELLYAIPVCAPWSTVLTYKFKVKLTPSAGKKGKAAKTAVQSFVADKAASPRERDLVKSVRMEDVTRNFPGRVKVVMPQAARSKKK